MGTEENFKKMCNKRKACKKRENKEKPVVPPPTEEVLAVEPELFEVDTCEVVQTLNRELAAEKEATAKAKDLYLRTLADLDNYRKRAIKERGEVRNNAIAEVIETLLPILDNFEFGLLAAQQHGQNTVVDGFKMIFEQLKSVLISYGIEEINPINQKFDLNFHDCVRRVVDNDKEPDTVVFVDRKGYRLKGKLIRPAVVTVSMHEEKELTHESV